MRTASLDKSSQVSPEQDWRAYQDVSDLIVSYSVRKSVRRIGFLTRSHGSANLAYKHRCGIHLDGQNAHLGLRFTGRAGSSP
jgi:hypothetical protein